MSIAATLVGAEPRGTRLTTLVSEAEHREIADKAAAAGQSVSAYLRDLALGSDGRTDERAALRQVDILIDRMERDLDSAIAELAATMARIGDAI